MAKIQNSEQQKAVSQIQQKVENSLQQAEQEVKAYILRRSLRKLQSVRNRRKIAVISDSKQG